MKFTKKIGLVTIAILLFVVCSAIPQTSKNFSKEDYVKVNNWNVVKLKQKEYVGKKIAITTDYMGVYSESEIWLSQIDDPNTFERSLVDKILTLKEYKSYTFYGTVKIDKVFGDPCLHIEMIE